LLPSAGVSATVRDASRTAEASPSPAPAVSLDHVSKTFRLPHEQYHTLKERALHPFRSRSFDELKAVQDVSVEIGQGEFFGIIGRNGSGKSTLLKCLAGIYNVDGGRLHVSGRLSPFIELGVGFNPDLTGRDNAILNAIMLGLTRKQARERFDEIVAFAELEEFMDLKLKNYSSGMVVRLAFAVAIQVDADIVLIDEVLAVGDVSFQQKCFDEFVRLKAAGRTIVFVTHDMGAIERFCDRVMLLERGRMVEIGAPAAIARRYNELNFKRVREEAKLTGAGPDTLRAAPVAEVLTACFESPEGEVVVTTNQGEACCMRMDVRFHSEIENPVFAFSLRSEAGQTAFATSTQVRSIETGHFHSGDIAVVRVPFENWLGPGRYRLMTSVALPSNVADIYDLHVDSSILVLANRPGGGTADLPHSFEIERT